MNKKLTAFTLLELLVGMVVSSIVIAAAFSAFSIVSRQHTLYRLRHETSTEASFFCSTLRRDLAKAFTISGGSDELTLVQATRTLHYRNRPPVVLRDDGQQVDTFYVQVSRWRCFADELELTGAATTATKVQLELQVNNTPLPLVLTQPQAADQQLMRLLNDEEQTDGD